MLSLYHHRLLRHARALSGRLRVLRRGRLLHSWDDRGWGGSDLLPYRILAGGSSCDGLCLLWCLCFPCCTWCSCE